MGKVIVIGGGPAGMFAAITAAEGGCETVLYEQNEKLGKKLFITGKGRCNITNACNPEELIGQVVSNSKFLYSAFYSCSSDTVMEYFEDQGMPVKVERGNRVFPVSDHSSDVIKVLERQLREKGVKVCLNTKVDKLLMKDGHAAGIQLENGRTDSGSKVIIATGGISYPSTGATGDGYQFAKTMGHSVTPLYPSLVPLEAQEDYLKELQGLSLKNVTAVVYDGKKQVYQGFGEMLFTHYGVSGPLILSASADIAALLAKRKLRLLIDLKPALTQAQLDQRLLREFKEAGNKIFKNMIRNLLPLKLIPVIIRLSEIGEDKRCNEITREERQRLLTLLKNFPVTLTGSRGYREAVITKGGVSIKEIDPGTMESKLIRGIYYIGEVLDLDAYTGGFNLQIAWSTGYLAGIHAAGKE